MEMLYVYSLAHSETRSSKLHEINKTAFMTLMQSHVSVLIAIINTEFPANSVYTSYSTSLKNVMPVDKRTQKLT